MADRLPERLGTGRSRRVLETVVYAATAAFGLDFTIASWRSLWTPS